MSQKPPVPPRGVVVREVALGAAVYLGACGLALWLASRLDGPRER